MQGKNQDIVQETIRLETYARQNKGLSGYTPKIPLSVTPSTPPAANPYAGLSDAELNAKYQMYNALVKGGMYATESEGKLKYEMEVNKIILLAVSFFLAASHL
jgi:hypothetical protein